MNNLSNYKGYITGLKKSGLHKSDMIDYIAGIYSNMATRNDCLAFTLKYINPKQPEKIINETNFRRMLRKSEDKVIRELFFLAQERYKHVSRYRDDGLDKNDKTLSQIHREKINKKDLKKESFEDQEIENGLSFDSSNSFQDMSSDVVDKLGDLESHLRDLVSNDTISLNQDQLDVISKLEKMILNQKFNKFGSIKESLNSINDNKTRILVLKVDMYLGKLIKESKRNK